MMMQPMDLPEYPAHGKHTLYQISYLLASSWMFFNNLFHTQSSAEVHTNA
jgi:hypothetical protein